MIHSKWLAPLFSKQTASLGTLTWLVVILDRPEITPKDLLPTDGRGTGTGRTGDAAATRDGGLSRPRRLPSGSGARIELLDCRNIANLQPQAESMAGLL
jgi:hypothetical protein